MIIFRYELSGSAAGFLNFIYLESYRKELAFRELEDRKTWIVTYILTVDVCRSRSWKVGLDKQC